MAQVKPIKNLLTFKEISQNFIVFSINILKSNQINVKIFPTFFKIDSTITLTRAGARFGGALRQNIFKITAFEKIVANLI